MDEVGEHRRRLVPARVVVELRALVEAEGEVVIGTDPLGGVDGAGLESRRNLAARQVDDVGARSFEDRAAEAGNAQVRKSVVEEKSVSVRVDIGGSRIIKKKTKSDISTFKQKTN